MSWRRNLSVVDAQMRAGYYRRLIEVAAIPASLARYHTENATIEDMSLYLSCQPEIAADNRRLTYVAPEVS